MKTNGGSSAVEHSRKHEREVAGSNPRPPYFSMRRGLSKHFAFKWGERLGRDECPYLRRWALVAGLFSVRLHHFYRSDDARAFHDHPWWFVTLVLKGGYTDVSPCPDCGGTGMLWGEVPQIMCLTCEGSTEKLDHLGPGSVRFRPALHRHTVRVDGGGVWTCILSGPNLRTWGFYPGGRFKKANKWFLENGHHPCDQP